jgi:hypothetical protein
MTDTRRDFLKFTAAGATLSWLVNSANAGAARRDGAEPRRRVEAAESAVPTVQALRTVAMPHRFGDLFNPPGLTNQWGCAQAALDVVGIRSVSFPPYAQGEQSTAALNATGEILTGILYVDGEYFAATKQPIEFVWQPDRIERRARHKSLALSSTTIVPFKRMAVAVAFTVENTGTERYRGEVKLALRGGVAKSVTPWNAAYSPGEFDNDRTVDRARGAVLFKSRHSATYGMQGAWPAADEVLPSWLVYRLDLGPGEKRTITFANVIGESANEAARAYDALVRDFDGEAARVRDEWNAELAAVYTPGNGRFSGHLPTLVTADDGVRRLYHTAAMSALFFRRTTPHSVYGTTYVTLAPRYWQTTTFLWDISLSAMLLAMLDPAVLRRMMETWMQLDVHKHFGTEYLTGAGVGPWYSVNDFAMCRMAREYLRWTGDRAWLDKDVGGRKVVDRIVDYATHWRALDTNKHGLADYGGISNLLEAVSNYVHEVAGLNAANVYNLRFASELLAARGEAGRARALADEATALAGRVKELYVPGKGIWNCRLPDGSMHEVRHCYDFGTVLITMGSDLIPEQRREMVRFFREELQTPTWMRALSTRDIDVTFSIRPDHQWTGAYAAWPALALGGLYAAGEDDAAFEWMGGLAKTSEQGPIAQAHFAEDVFAPEAGGGALKAPSDQPYINDWACVSGCAYLEPIVESLFGVRAGLFGKIDAEPRFGAFDPRAELRGLRYQGKDYVASASGVRPEGR